MAGSHESNAQEIVYEGSHVTVGHRLAVALGSGLTVFAATSFLRWGCGPMGIDRRGLLAGLILGGVVAVGMAIAALRSRVVWRVALDRSAGELRIDRDPGEAERWPLRDIAGACAQPVAGGWSRDPAERLVLSLRGGDERVFSMPDDALTTGIAADICVALSTLETPKEIAVRASGGVAGAGEVREEGVQRAALGAVAIPQATGDGDGGGG
jgi:hypothetical protein